MNVFFRLNVISIIYAFILFIPIELIVNVHRISRVTGWNIDIVNLFIIVITFLVILFFTIISLYLSKKWLKRDLTAYWTVLLWIPYFVLFTYLTTYVLPKPLPEDFVSPGTGLLIIGTIVLFPIYVFIINLIVKLVF